MTDLSPKLRGALAHVDVAWDQEREDQTWQGLRVKRTRRAVARASAAAAAVLLAAGGAWYWQQGRGGPDRSAVAERPEVAPAPERVAPAPQVESLELRFADGSVATRTDADAELEVVADSTERVAVRVVRGKSRFAVPRTPEREFEVEAGDIQIAVYSTQFSVARYEERTEVWADDGYLKIEWQGKVQEVRAGETASFPPPGAIDAPAREDGIDRVVRAQTPREQVEDLMRAADRARLGQRPADALKPLGRVVSKFPRDSRAPLAAFTLGRVLLDDLDEPARAARAFRKARELAPKGALAEDALAREAEAWQRAGETERATDRAQLYLERYPDGHRVPAMRQILK